MVIFDLIADLFDFLIAFLKFVILLIKMLPVILVIIVIGFIALAIYRKTQRRASSDYQDSQLPENHILAKAKTPLPPSRPSSSPPPPIQEDNSLIYPDVSGLPRFHVYKLKGKNPKTNRQKTETVVAKEGTSPEIVAQKTELLPPYSLTLDPNPRTERPASEAQINFAKDINIPIPEHCSVEDMSLLIGRQTEENMTDYITPELFQFAGEQGICLSPYSSPEIGISSILNSSCEQICLEFFAYFIYCSLHGIWHITSPECSPHHAIFKDFGQDFFSNSELLETIRSLSYNNILYIRAHGKIDKRSSKNAQAFSLTCDFLNSHLPAETPSIWEKWRDCHHLPQQIQRQWRSYDKRITPLFIDHSSKSGQFQGVSGRYMTTLSTCSCPDFSRKQKPCKHMYRLAYELRDKPKSSESGTNPMVVDVLKRDE